MSPQRCEICDSPLGDGEFVSGHRTCALCRSGSRRRESRESCLKCGLPLTDADPAITTLGPRCRRCW